MGLFHCAHIYFDDDDDDDTTFTRYLCKTTNLALVDDKLHQKKKTFNAFYVKHLMKNVMSIFSKQLNTKKMEEMGWSTLCS